MSAVSTPPDRLRRNITRYLLFAILRGIPAGISIVLWVVFLQQRHGFSLTQVTLLDLPFWIGRLLFEIPTGLIADHYGRRLSLAVSAVISSITWAVFALINSFPLFLLMQVFGAFGATFQTGADDALLFESMYALRREDEYPRIAGRARALETISGMLAGLAAGWIAQTNIVLPVVIASIVYALTLLPILMMAETGAPPTEQRQAAPLRTYWQTVRDALVVFRTQPIARWAAIYGLVVGSIGFYVTVFLPPFGLTLGLSLAALGPLMVTLQLLGVLGGLAVGLAQRYVPRNLLLLGLPLLLVPLFALAGVVRAVPVVVLLAVQAFFIALVQPVLGALVHERISNAMRATFVSIQQLLAMVFLIITEPGLGLLADRFGPQSAFLGMAVLLVLFCVFLAAQSRWLFQAESSVMLRTE